MKPQEDVETLKRMLIKTETEEHVMPFSWYQSKALHIAEPPKNPTFFYLLSTKNRIPESVRATLWFASLVLLVPLLWMTERFAVHHLPALLVFDLLFALVGFWLAPWPSKKHCHKNNPEYLKKIGCLVPCHKSADEIANTVSCLLKFLEPEHIIVVDNGNSVTPLDNTGAVVRDLEPRVRYMWIPIGNKTNALWRGLNELPSTVEYVMHIDDDTDIPHDFVFDESIWNDPKTSSTSYSIEMKRTGFVEKLVDWEFRQISQLRNFESKMSTVWFAHGIIGIWRRQAFHETMQENPSMFFGEDGWNGINNLLKGQRMHQECRSSVSTYAPSAILPGCGGSREQGYGAANIWKQRSYRWNVTPPRRIWLRVYLFFTYKGANIMDTLFFRVYTLHHIMNILIHLAAPFCMMLWLWNGLIYYVLMMKLAMLTSSYVKNFALNYLYLYHRPDLQVDFKVLMVTPFYNYFLGICAVIGNWRSVLSYIPFNPLRFGLYTEGKLDPESLQKYHGIRCVDDSTDSGGTSESGSDSEFFDDGV